jgi:predicted DNA-binding protein YlxM (UPF0122 family)
MATTSTRKILLRTAERINASRLEDLAKCLRVSRQAIHQRAIYHGIYDELKAIFRENKSELSLLPKKPGIIIFQKNNDKVYWYSTVSIKYIARTYISKFKDYKLSYIVTESNAILECLKKRFEDPSSRLLYETADHFPYIHLRKSNNYYVCAPKSQKYIGCATTFESAIAILKQYVMFNKRKEKKKPFIQTVSKDKLYKLYVEKKLNLDEIALIMNTSASTIYLNLKKLKIPINNIGRPRNDN